MNFYLQKFEDYNLLQDWESQLQIYESHTKTYSQSSEITPVQQVCMN